MDIKMLKDKLLELSKEIKPLIHETDRRGTDNLFPIEYDDNNPDELFWYQEFSGLLTHLHYINWVMDYLQKPVIHQGIIRVSEDGKYVLDVHLQPFDDLITKALQ